MNTKTKTKTASAKKAPKIRMKIERELSKYPLSAAHFALRELSTKLLADMCKLHDVPVAKYKDDMVSRLAHKLVIELGKRVIVKIL